MFRIKKPPTDTKVVVISGITRSRYILPDTAHFMLAATHLAPCQLSGLLPEYELVRAMDFPLVVDRPGFLRNVYPLALGETHCRFFFVQLVARQIPSPGDRVFDPVLIDLNCFHLRPAQATRQRSGSFTSSSRMLCSPGHQSRAS